MEEGERKFPKSHTQTTLLEWRRVRGRFLRAIHRLLCWSGGGWEEVCLEQYTDYSAGLEEGERKFA